MSEKIFKHDFKLGEIVELTRNINIDHFITWFKGDEGRVIEDSSKTGFRYSSIMVKHLKSGRTTYVMLDDLRKINRSFLEL
jgi:hypothetical protein